MEQQHMDSNELKRRRRERFAILLTIAVIIVLTYIESHISSIENLLPISNEVFIFGLININLILIILLIFLITRNLVKLIFERRRGILGSKLRTKLVAAFVCLSLVPTAVLFLVSIKFLAYSIDNWFEMRLGNALNSSLEIAQTYYGQAATDAQYYARLISSEITQGKLYDQEQEQYLKTILAQRQKYFNLGAVEVFFDNRNENISLKDPNHTEIPPTELSPRIIEDIYMGKDASTVTSMATGDAISGIAPLYTNFSPREVIGMVAVTSFINKDLIEKMSLISKTSEEYGQLKLLQNPIKFSYIMMLFIVTLLITFSATWFGLFLAKGITVPIQDLAEATHEIAGGNLDYHIDVLAEDEIGVLVNSFNQMTQDLKKSSESLRQANIDLDQRRTYMETVLRNVSAGVVSIDRNDVISTINRAAEEMLNIRTDEVLYRRYTEVLQPEHMELAREFLKELDEVDSDSLEKQIQLTLKDRVLTVLVSATVLRDDGQNYMGMVVVFEDLTEIQKAERVAAWREVARRIAHEIKNPLTPVKLSAERLQRKYGDTIDGGNGSVFRECTKTIIDQVEVLKNLVNEFSRFARMPMAHPEAGDISAVIEDSITLFEDSARNISFSFKKQEDLPMVNIDVEQMKRVMINLIDNAVAAITTDSKEGGLIEITAHVDSVQNRVRVDVRDNGPGIAPKDRTRLFEPYFSTKKHGTGLGLAIVNSIISDHNGTVTVSENVPHGTIISFDIPIA
ncbi:MAG: HAMP domain-containing protein [Deltaproteobacteria bacterium]|nr:HAMP domain-containing protein [Deltaproteobacteria bacterium]